MTQQHFYSKDFLPEPEPSEFVKIRPTRAVRMVGTFHCLTSEGNVASCSDGWLAIDSRGYPYPINALEFRGYVSTRSV